MPAGLVGPGRGVRVLEVGHEPLRARVERVDDQLAVGRPGDLHAAVEVVPGRRGHGPVALADLARLGQEVERPAARELRRPLAPRGEQLVAARAEALVQLGDERERLVREDLLADAVVLQRRGLHGLGHGRVPRIEWSSRVIGWNTGSVEVRADLDRAARVAGGDRLGARRAQVRGLALAQLGRGGRLDEVVDPRGAAAELPLGGLAQLELRDAVEQGAGLGADLLGVGEVAGVVVGDGHRQRMARRLRLELREQLAHVAHLRREGLRAVRPRRIVLEQVRVVLHPRAAAGDVHRDVLEVLVRGDRRLGERERLVLDAGVQLERAAAARLPGRVDLEALGGQHAHGRGVDVAEEHALDAALHERDPPPPRALRGRDLGELLDRRPPRHRRRELQHRLELGHAAEALGQRVVDAQLLLEPQHRRERPQAARVREEREDQPAGAAAPGAGAAPRAPPAAARARSAGRTSRPTGRRSRRPCSRGSGRGARGARPTAASRARCPRASGRSARAACPSRPRRPCSSGTWAGRSRSARSRRSGPGRADGGRPRRS